MVVERVEMQVVQDFNKVVGEVRQVKEMLVEKVVEEVRSLQEVQEGQEVQEVQEVQEFQEVEEEVKIKELKDTTSKCVTKKNNEKGAIHFLEPSERFTERSKNEQSSDVVVKPTEKPVRSLIQKYNNISKSNNNLDMSKESSRRDVNMHHEGVKSVTKMHAAKPMIVKKGSKLVETPATQSTLTKAKMEKSMTKVTNLS